MIEGRARSLYAPVAARKVNRVAHLIRGKPVPEALSILLFLNKPTKKPLLKTLQSAVANALQKAGRAKLKEEDLVVYEARVDTGPQAKRFRAMARGQAGMIRHRTCHVLVRVGSKEA